MNKSVSNQHTSFGSSLKGKNVLIFGGTSGIGLSAALQAKALGASVTVVGSSSERSQAVANEHQLSWLAADVTKPDEITRALSETETVDHLVLLSGSFVVGKVLETDISVFHRVFEERIWGAVHILSALGDKLAADASITFVSGALADRPTAYGTSVSAAAFAAIETFARNLALELAPRRVNTIAPGPIDTPILTKALGDGRDAYVESLKEQLPVRRIGTPEEAGEAIVFLMANGFMNGATLNIDGGMRLN